MPLFGFMTPIELAQSKACCCTCTYATNLIVSTLGLSTMKKPKFFKIFIYNSAAVAVGGLSRIFRAAKRNGQKVVRIAVTAVKEGGTSSER